METATRLHMNMTTYTVLLQQFLQMAVNRNTLMMRSATYWITKMHSVILLLTAMTVWTVQFRLQNPQAEIINTLMMHITIKRVLQIRLAIRQPLHTIYTAVWYLKHWRTVRHILMPMMLSAELSVRLLRKACQNLIPMTMQAISQAKQISLTEPHHIHTIRCIALHLLQIRRMPQPLSDMMKKAI